MGVATVCIANVTGSGKVEEFVTLLQPGHSNIYKGREGRTNKSIADILTRVFWGMFRVSHHLAFQRRSYGLVSGVGIRHALL